MISVFQLRYNQLQIVKDRKKNMKKRFWTRFCFVLLLLYVISFNEDLLFDKRFVIYLCYYKKSWTNNL